MRTRTKRWLLLAGLGCAGAIAGGGIASAVNDGSGPIAYHGETGLDDGGERPAFGRFPADADGDGAISDTGAERLPALLEVVADDGTSGYVRLSDFDKGPANPEEAVAMTKARQRLGHGRVLRVFAQDGKTVVGTFTEGRNSAPVTSPAP